MRRRDLLLRGTAASVACLGLPGTSRAAAEVELTDLAGRRVAVPARVERVLLGEGRFLPTLALLDREDPLARLAGMMGEFERLDAPGYGQWRSRFPRLDAVPRVGRATGGSFSVEQAIALRPQLAVFGLEGHGPAPQDRETLARLQAAGCAILFIDLRQDPLLNTPRSVSLLGQALGRPREAAEFVGYYRQEAARVTEVLKTRRPPAPAVFLENRVGLGEGCCDTMVGLMGKLLDAAGGRNIARGRVPGEDGTLSLEYLLSAQPQCYIGTAIGGAATAQAGSMRVALGAGVDEPAARASLRRALQRRGIAQLQAVQAGRAYAIWHHFYNSPFNVAALQVFAQWLHPQTFATLDPRATLETLYRRFQPVPLDGQYWVSLR
ncbi:ABC transporter substrate-binding protein [Aquabacterium sp. A7-Y]|uniref:ABC transporter substrate-binding protein n=1 Tax=Aquabacterium sp. A7-Y TaxID=1349605 RepID=UPI00223DAF37|nr:ABC transporter substrate-binding protein [Aquabacterium sp. A7-Y]MCW7539444.1 ABC transporter substrate-binding protein [Aquabacterium sp. A7-Y]